MARRAPTYSRQRRLEQDLKEGLDDLKGTRKTLRDAYQALLRGERPKPGRIGKIPTRDYREMLRLEKQFGLYQPTATTLTPSRKASIRRHWEELEGLMETSVYAEFPQGTTGRTKKKIARELRQSFGTPKGRKPRSKATRKGVFLETAERQIGPIRETQQTGDVSERVVSRPTVGRLRYDRETGSWAVQVGRKTKSGLQAQELRYIAGSDALDRKKDRMRKRFDKMAPLKRNQRLRFIIGNNESRRTFRNMDELFRYAEHYRKDDAARATFLNELIIEVVQKGPARYRPDRRRGKGSKTRGSKDIWTDPVRAFRASNYHELSPDIVRDMMEESEDE